MRATIVSVPEGGHALTAIGLAGGLRGRGHDVTVVTGPDHRDAAAAVGARHVALPAPESAGRGRAAPATVDALTGAVRRTDPDIVLVDVLTRVGVFAADRLRLPWIELVPHYLPVPDPHLPPIGAGWRYPAPWWRRWPDAHIRRRQRASIDAGAAAERRARMRLGLSTVSRPIGRLVATLPALEYPRPAWPDRTRVVGGLAADPAWPAADLPPGDEPLVVVTDSTVAAVDVSLAALALTSLRDLPIRLVATTSRKLQPWPDRCAVARAPHGPLLDQAAIAVGFGGHGFVVKSLGRGVPMVVVPLQGDQPETAARIRWTGAGRRVQVRRGGALRWAVARVLTDPAYRRAARSVSESGRRLGPDYAAACVEAFAAGR